jgi:hypothetical protein
MLHHKKIPLFLDLEEHRTGDSTAYELDWATIMVTDAIWVIGMM